MIKSKYELDLSDPERAYAIAYYHGRWALKPEGYNLDSIKKNGDALSAWFAGLEEGASDRTAIAEYKGVSLEADRSITRTNLSLRRWFQRESKREKRQAERYAKKDEAYWGE